MIEKLQNPNLDLKLGGAATLDELYDAAADIAEKINEIIDRLNALELAQAPSR
jgi:hypothetical protein